MLKEENQKTISQIRKLNWQSYQQFENKGFVQNVRVWSVGKSKFDTSMGKAWLFLLKS